MMDTEHIPVCSYGDWNDVSDALTNNKLSILTINTRGLMSKFPELFAYLGKLHNRMKFIVIVESWLNEVNDRALDLPGYKSYSLYRVCLLYTSPSPRDKRQSRMPSSA